MPIWLKIFLVILILFSISSFIFFLLGVTVYFQRIPDIIGTTIFWGAAIPTFLISIFLTILIFKKWIPNSLLDYIGLLSVMTLLIILSVSIIQSVHTHGWLKEKVVSDSVQFTEDKQYQYHVDLINLFQRNSSARLYLKEVKTNKEFYITVDIHTRDIIVLRESKVNHWIVLKSTNRNNHYILQTTKDLSIPEEKFEIDIINKSSTRIY